MSTDVTSLLDRICDIVSENIDADCIETAKRRHAATLAWRDADYIPMQFGKEYKGFEKEQFPEFNWAEQWHDPAKSLYEQLKGLVHSITSGSDFVPCVRSDTGVVNCMTVFGAKITVPEHTKPIVTEYVSKEALREFEVPEDIGKLGIMPNVTEHMEHHLSVLRSHGLDKLINVCHCDQQGPFDVAAQARGHDIFIDLYEDGDFVHELMEKATQVYIAVTKLCKRISGEPLDSGNAVGIWMENGSIRMCGDSDILVSAEQFDRFIFPYAEKAFAEFGGGWFHYCGGWKGTGRSEGLHLHDSYGRIKGLRGMNWTTAGDWLAQMRKLKDLGVVHIGQLPRDEGESLEDYFRRTLSPYDRRCGLLFQSPELKDDEPDSAMDVWHKIQDEKFACIPCPNK